jgi:hypothetical protein
VEQVFDRRFWHSIHALDVRQPRIKTA